MRTKKDFFFHLEETKACHERLPFWDVREIWSMLQLYRFSGVILNDQT